MRRITAIAVMSLFVLASMPGPALAAVSYHKADASFNANTAEYSVAIKETGLGGATAVSYSLTATASFTAVCVNKGGHEITSGPKSGSGTATTVTTLAVHNGQTSGTITIGPAAFSLPNPGCTGSQRLEITAAFYTNVQLLDGLGTPSPSLPDLGGSGLSIIL